MVGRLIARIALLPALAMAATAGVAGAQAPADARDAFARITAPLAAILLSDPENGEVLGSALELVESVERVAEQPSPAGGLRLEVRLAPGARDRLRRSREFERTDAGGRVTFAHRGPPSIRIELGDRAGTAIVSLPQP